MKDLRRFKLAYHKFQYSVRTIVFAKDSPEYVLDAAWNLVQCVRQVFLADLEFHQIPIEMDCSLAELFHAVDTYQFITITDGIRQQIPLFQLWESKIWDDLDFQIISKEFYMASYEVFNFLEVNGLVQN